jgi:hypothetical protein
MVLNSMGGQSLVYGALSVRYRGFNYFYTKSDLEENEVHCLQYRIKQKVIQLCYEFFNCIDDNQMQRIETDKRLGEMVTIKGILGM